MKYYFIEALSESLYNLLKNVYGHSESSDISKNPEGWILTDEEIHNLPFEYNLYKIPEEYQDKINIFKSDFWDGEIILQKIDWV